MSTSRPPRRSILGVAVVALALVFAAAVPAAAVQEEHLETHAFAADGRVSVENINGDIEVVAWDRAEVEIEVLKEASSVEMLRELEAEIRVDGTSLRITTHYPDSKSSWFGRDRNGHMSVDYRLKVPRGVRIDELETVNGGVRIEGVSGTVIASTVNGGIEAFGLAGDEVDLSTVNGSVEAEFATLGNRQRVELSSVNGRVRIDLPADADAEINAETVHGSLRDDFGFRIDEGEYVGKELRGTLGSGSAEVELETVNGSIRINRR